MDKIIPFNKLSEYVERKRREKKKQKIILCHGCFDIVHPGHIRHLKFAKEQGTLLIVSITPDSCIQKGSSRPFVPEQLRAENLAALEFVEAVTIAPKETAIEVIEAILPDIYVKGSEYALSLDPRFLKEKELVEKLGGKVAYSSGDVTFSSTEFIMENDLKTAADEKLRYIVGRYDITREKINEVFRKAKDKRILVIGDAVVDEYKYCEGLGIGQEAPVLSLELRRTKNFLGQAPSIATYFTSLGSSAVFLSSFANASTQEYDFLTRHFKQFNIPLLNIHSTTRPLVVKSHFYVDKQQVMEISTGVCRPLDSAKRNKLLKTAYSEMRKQPDCLILADAGHQILTDDITTSVMAYAHEHNIKVTADITLTQRANIDKFNDADILTATEKELRYCMHDYENGLSVLVDRFYSISNVKELYLMLSDGSGLFFKRPERKGIHNMESIHIPSLMNRTGDSMGCSEAFLVGVILGRICGANEGMSLYLGVVCSSVMGRLIGNEFLDSEDIYRLLDERKEFFSLDSFRL